MIDLSNTWCEATVPNHDKLRLLGFNHEPVSHNINYYYIDANHEIYSFQDKEFDKTAKQIQLVNGKFEYIDDI